MILTEEVFQSLEEPDEEEEDMLDLALGLTDTYAQRRGAGGGATLTLLTASTRTCRAGRGSGAKSSWTRRWMALWSKSPQRRTTCLQTSDSVHVRSLPLRAMRSV